MRTVITVTYQDYAHFLAAQYPHSAAYLPDHWTTATDLPYQPHEPVLGVRASDAQTYCTWRNAQSSASGPHYRLPHLHESLSQIAQSEECPDIYWAMHQEQCTLCLPPMLAHQVTPPTDTPSFFDAWATHDLTHAYAALYRQETIPLATHAEMFHLPLTPVLQTIRRRAHTRPYTRDVDLDVAAHSLQKDDGMTMIGVFLDRERSGFLARELSRDMVLTQTLADLLRFDLGNYVERAIARDLARNLAYSLDLINTYHVRRALTRAHEQAYTCHFDRYCSNLISLNDLINQTTDTHLHPLMPYLHQTLTLLRDRVAPPSKDETRAAAQSLRWVHRLLALTIATEYALSLQHANESIPLPTTALAPLHTTPILDIPRIAEQVITACLDLYLDSIIVEERINGTLRPREGLVMVQEPQ